MKLSDSGTSFTHCRFNLLGYHTNTHIGDSTCVNRTTGNEQLAGRLSNGHTNGPRRCPPKPVPLHSTSLNNETDSSQPVVGAIYHNIIVGGEYFGLRVRGDSMDPKYVNGDTVIIRRQSDCDTGDDCVVFVNGFDATLKTVIKHDDGIELKPYNQKYNSMFFDSGVEIIGVVIELRRRLKNITL